MADRFSRVIASVPLHRDAPDGVVLEAGELIASQFRYPGGVSALRLRNSRGLVTVLPWMGQMIWDARFDGIDLGMRSLFPEPVAGARSIGETYGCLAFHSGLLRNGVPGPTDTHPAHGEFPCAVLGECWLDVLDDPAGPALRLRGERWHTEGFGAAYLASPSVTLGAGRTAFEMAMRVENRSGRLMPLMYMAHVNFGFVPDGRIVQPAPFDPAHVSVRRAVPAHVRPDPTYLVRIAELAAAPDRMAVLHRPERFDPEQVFYLSGLRPGPDGRVRQMLRSPEGWAFTLAHRPDEFERCVRWLMCDPDQGVAAFSLPSTCEPEGYTAELAKNNVRFLPPKGEAHFAVEIGYLDPDAAQVAEDGIVAAGRGAGEG